MDKKEKAKGDHTSKVCNIRGRTHHCNSMDVYPSALDIASLQENKKILSPVLQTFLDILITKSGSDLKKAAIGQAILQACQPLIDLHPAYHGCVYTTLKFVCEEAKRLNVTTPSVKFNQYLWIKPMEVICSNHESEFDNMVIDLADFTH
ncbi:hypothetical protein PR048_023135 [Dryococelus australis]|uniref:Uncharacterized protein n=1 Tax=Dryococelus australis TaxID=614101 RepID=A0ABQ9GT82_9NEOP|nr:hypothetical protein PR048_023135 [Dryococelus australis]